LNNDNCTALHFAAYNSHCDVIEELLNSKADINAKIPMEEPLYT